MCADQRIHWKTGGCIERSMKRCSWGLCTQRYW